MKWFERLLAALILAIIVSVVGLIIFGLATAAPEIRAKPKCHCDTKENDRKHLLHLKNTNRTLELIIDLQNRVEQIEERP